ncbi:LOW QUALITY PROTEIN: venom protease-like [Panulirus ornatus]|uniref:LOW QUALITY PROTEIN: venom protease-like n=1 Tax=Panulirus ornatus TaxID=150431 RepID=UPI003A89B6F0
MSKAYSSSLLTSLLLLAAVAGTWAHDVVFPEEEEVDHCQLRDGRAGRCVDIRSCPVVLEDIHSSRPVDCRFNRFSPVVCCPLSTENVSTRIEDTMSPPALNFDCGVNVYNTVVLDRWNSGPIQILRPEEPNQEPDHSKAPHLTGRPGIPKEALDKADESLRAMASLGEGIFATVGGIAANKSAWPWMALIGEYVGDEKINWFCGGVLINEQWVLSALHCFLRKHPEVVRLGEHDYNDDWDGADHEDFGVSQTVVYPGYTHPQAYHDLALLKLDAKVALKTFIKPVCLPWEQRNFAGLTGEKVTLAGWGDTLFGGYPSSVLQEVNVTVFPSSACDEKYSSLVVYKDSWPEGIRDETICAGDPEGGKDACRGDSGGPIVRLSHKGRYTLAGIVSKGHGCGHKDYPGLYVNINQLSYLKWIKETAF